MTTTPVHSITDEQIAEIETLAKKATQGEWWIDSHGHRMTAGPYHETVFVADDRIGKATRHPETGNLSHWPNDWDASYIATACPANILALITRLREAEKDAARMEWLATVNGLRIERENSIWYDIDGGSYISTHMLCANGTQFAGIRNLRIAIDTAMQGEQ